MQPALLNDDKSNSTRFIVVTNQKIYRKEAKKVSVCFELPHESGALYHILSHFIYNNLNITISLIRFYVFQKNGHGVFFRHTMG